MSASADDSTSNTLMVDEGNDDTEMGTWKEVHQQLINAVIISKDAIAIQKAQRRYWLTEINANLTEDGKLTATSVWKRPGKKRGRAPGSKTTKPKKTVKPKPKAKTAKLDADGNPVKKRKYTKRKKPEEEPAVATAASAVEEEAAVAAAAAAVQKAAAVGEDDSDDDDDDDSDEDLESSKPPAKKLRLSLNIKNPASEEASQGDDETEDEDDEDDDDMPEESFLGASGGSALPPAAHSPHHSSFMPSAVGGNYPSFMMQNSRGPSIMAPTSAFGMPEQGESDDDTEEDDY